MANKIAAVILPYLCSLFGYSQGQLVDSGGIEADELMRSFHDVLPEEQIPLILKDQKHHAETVQAMGKFSKLSTSWLPLRGSDAVKEPRFATEKAIFLLKELAFPDDSFDDVGIMGAEWWFQNRKVTDNIGFHYDKDEGIASEQMRMVYPRISTVTYLTSSGSPTMILDMITPDGNGNVPQVAEDGYLSFPRKNKHITFSGRLMHGVIGELHQLNAKKEKSEDRVTLLINWWTSTPIPPNCIPLTHNDVKAYKKISGHAVEDFQSWSSEATDGSITTVPIPSTSSFQRIVLPPVETQYYAIPDRYDPDHDTVHLQWSAKQKSGPIHELDLFKESTTHMVFNSVEPKVLLFHAGDVRDAEKLVLEASRKYSSGNKPQFLFYVGDQEKAGNAWEYFGVTERDVPKVVIHDTKNEKRYKMDTEITTKNLDSFLSKFLAKKLSPMREEL
eukprot:m.115389 g.115389  ORF g.115389 m.115389 type:complete len:445 (+) comp14201_c0_seq2:212-1546(+)